MRPISTERVLKNISIFIDLFYTHEIWYYCRGVNEVSQKPGGVFGDTKKESAEIEVD
jgi:hypothetical protein